MRTRDAMEFINEQDAATLQRFVARLEERGHDPTFAGYREEYLRRMGLTPSSAVLDLGCGTGVIARAIAAQEGFSGPPVVALDQSPVMISAARKLATDDGLGSRIDFRIGDAHALALPDRAFDAVIAHTLVSHVRDPLGVITEAARVVRPGGAVTIFDGDYASWTFDCSDGELGRAMEQAILAALVSKPRVMREMPRLLSQAGLERSYTLANVYVDIGCGRFFLPAAETYAPLVANAGFLPADQVQAWLAEQRAAADAGVFFAACNFYAYLARRPT